jgi:hypothetical protein
MIKRISKSVLITCDHVCDGCDSPHCIEVDSNNLPMTKDTFEWSITDKKLVSKLIKQKILDKKDYSFLHKSIGYEY